MISVKLTTKSQSRNSIKGYIMNMTIHYT